MLRFIAIFFLCNCTTAQELLNPKTLDSLYREDQMYIGITYNLFQNTPKEYSPSGFSLGFNAGFLRDIPLNKERKYAIAPGIGIGIQSLNHNIGLTTSSGIQNYELLFTGNFTKNRWTFYSLDFPIEFRWRTSTVESHKFWRIYVGYKGSFLFNDVSRLTINQEQFVVRNNNDLRNFQSGVYISAGYNTWNFYFYHAINSIFKSNVSDINNNPLNLQLMTFGLQFYIL